MSYPPGPKGHFLLGNIADMQRDALGFLVQLHREYGDLVHFRLGPYHTHLVSDPATIHRILVDEADKFPRGRYSRDLLSKPIGVGLLTSDGAYHRRQRRLE